MSGIHPNGIHSIVQSGRAAAFIHRLPSRDDIDAARAYRSLYHFFRLSWKEVEPSQKLILNWHLEAICEHVQVALMEWIKAQEDETFVQRIRNLLVNVPPGSSKSRIVSVCAPAWMWLHHPSWRVACLSSNPTVALRDAVWSRDIIESDWYGRLFEPDWTLRDDQAGKTNFWNTAGGWRMSAGWFAKITGARNDCLILDDPHDAEEAQSDKLRRAVITRYDQSINNRVTSVKSVRMAICQKVHHEDFSSHVADKPSWIVLSIPQEFEPNRLKANPDRSRGEYDELTAIGWRDKRTQFGELLDAKRFPPDAVEEAKEDLGSYGYEAQHMQRAAPLVGGIWKRIWWGYWVPSGIELPHHTEALGDGTLFICRQMTLPLQFEFELQSWDMAFGNSETSSMVVGHVWGLDQKNRFLLDQVRARMDFVQTQKAVLALASLWPRVKLKLVENKANGPAIISSLKAEIEGLTEVDPEGDKVARAMAEQGALEYGRVFLPHPGLFTLTSAQMAFLSVTNPEVFGMIERAKAALAVEKERAEHTRGAPVPRIWVEGVVEESAKFPNGTFNDVVDTASQALARMRKFIKVRDAQNEQQTASTGWKNYR